MSCRYAPADLGGRPDPEGVVHELTHGGWGNDYGSRSLNVGIVGEHRMAVHTWHNCQIRAGDHLAIHHDGVARLYQVIEVRNAGDPTDLWFITAEHRRWPATANDTKENP